MRSISYQLKSIDRGKDQDSRRKGTGKGHSQAEEVTHFTVKDELLSDKVIDATWAPWCVEGHFL
jgi:hypothetical protein